MAGKGTTTETAGQLKTTECCMCGDLGFSDQLFQCKICQFRSQHRYCSNLYPKAEYFGTCNWCLNHRQKLEDTKDQKSPNSSNNSSSSSHKNNNNNSNNGTIVNDESNKRRLKKGLIRGRSSSISIDLQPIKKKQKSPEAKSSPKSPSPTPTPTPSPSVVTSTRKRIVTNGALEERLRRTKSEDIANRRSGGAASNATTRHVFRNKVRRYKLLDEVSS